MSDHQHCQHQQVFISYIPPIPASTHAQKANYVALVKDTDAKEPPREARSSTAVSSLTVLANLIVGGGRKKKEKKKEKQVGIG